MEKINKQPTPLFYGLMALLGLIVPCLGFFLSPVLLGKSLPEFISVQQVLILVFICFAATGYWTYLRFTQQNPDKLLFLTLILWPWLGFFSGIIRDNGTETYLTLWYGVLLVLPGVMVAYRLFPMMWKQIPIFRYFFIYIIFLIGYLFFNQAEVHDQHTNAGMFSLGFYFMFSMVAYLCQIALGAALLLIQDPKQNDGMRTCARWDALRGLMVVLALNIVVVSLIGIICFPLGIFTIIDGHLIREQAIFEHPSHYAHYLANGLLFLMGMLPLIPKGQRKLTILIVAAVGLGFLGLITSLSKTAIAIFLMCALLMFILHGLIAKGSRIRMIKTAALIIGVLSIALMGFQASTDKDMLTELTQRFGEQQSLDWRNRVSEYLTEDIHLDSVPLGHGMSAAKERMSSFEGFHFSKDTAGKVDKVIHVHNGYLSQFYDYGLIGMIPFFILLGLMGEAIIGLFRNNPPPTLTLRRKGGGDFSPSKDGNQFELNLPSELYLNENTDMSPPPLRRSGVPEKSEIFWGDRARVGGDRRYFQIALIVVCLYYLISTGFDPVFELATLPSWCLFTVLWMLGRPELESFQQSTPP